MAALKTVLIVLFVIISVLLILLVLVQNDEGGGLGGLLSGSGSAAFGSHSASVINKTTFVFVALFLVVAFSIALLTKAPAVKKLQNTDEVQVQESSNSEVFDWVESLDENAGADVNPESTLSGADAQ
ncbi:MAG: preprotein translocase subunit SecG [Treponema sp.]|uniref:preprotein translocase subunit SecG n=1 Tax=Treponema sp. TaxID=166 RepID=UPI001B3F038E|nr:preprotein translocase subunit SecG [Treponema sp.]MBP5587142.1 preprotein translocase subunit SecG [Treponema sp.]MBR0155851.1 preprotein translocase subunit SecG [Treponema sp.]MCR5385936.1 preprotein translocase subunit SecG [Treponema sp.]